LPMTIVSAGRASFTIFAWFITTWIPVSAVAAAMDNPITSAESGTDFRMQAMERATKASWGLEVSTEDEADW
jgi:hypothetical protein